MARKKSSKLPGLIILLVLLSAALLGATVWWGHSLASIITPIKNPVTKLIDQWLPIASKINPKPTQTATRPVAYKFAILSDSHEDMVFFPKIIGQISQRTDLSFVAHLGDLSNAGDKTKLDQAKQILDHIQVPVYVLPGDHDLNWYPQHDLTNFKQVFNKTRTYFSFTKGQQHFLFIDNSNLNTGIDPDQWQWITQDLATHAHQDIYVFMSTPLSNPYLSFKAMGARSDQVTAQAKQLGQLLKQYPVKTIFAGDTHIYSQYTDKDSGLHIVTVGAAGSDKNPLPLFVLVEIFTDGGYNVASIPYQATSPTPSVTK